MKHRFLAVLAVLTAISGFAGMGGAVFAQTQTAPAKGAFSADQYKEALWMVTRFYGAQRSGIGPNWLLMDHAYKTGFTNDKDGTYNLEGGWFDCGDHVLFGQTFFYTAYLLAKAYEAFPTGFHDLYNGKDYSDYAESKNWGVKGGKGNGIPDLLEELKYATDWIIKATPNGSTFYYEKGEGDKDHKVWVTSGKMSTFSADSGGEPRKMWKNPSDGIMASFAAGALATMSKIYRKYDTAYADTCLNHAKLAYTYAKANKNKAAGAGSGSYYGPGKAPENTFNIAAAEMFRITKDNSYKSDIGLNKDNVPYHNWAFDYQNPHDIVPYAVAMAVPEDKIALLDKMRSTFIDKFTQKLNSEKVATTGNADWGALRYPANHAFLAALYQTAKDTAAYDQFIYNQVDYILGSNNSKQSFVVGFCEGCSKQATKPHHRNVYLNDEGRDSKGMSALTIPERNKYFGYMVGGAFNSADFKDDINTYKYSEGGLDYNVGLVGALAYVVSKLAPADTSKFGIVVEPPPPPPPVQTPTKIQISLSSNPKDTASFIKDSILINNLYKGDSGKQLYAHVFDQNGIILDSVICGNITWDFTVKNTLTPVPITPLAQSALSDTGCSFTAPDGLNGSLDAIITSIKATYVYIGFDRPSISKSITVYVPPISVLPRNISLAKHGYAMTVKPHAVTFTAAAENEITALGIYNIQGKRIFAASGKHKEISWNRANSPRGMYMVKLTLNNGAIVQRNLILK